LSDAAPWLRELADLPRRFHRGVQTVHRADVLPMVSNRAFRVRTHFHQRQDDQGVLWALGDIIAGIVSYVEAGRLHVHYNGFGDHVALAPLDLPIGPHVAIVEYEALGGRRGRGRLLLDDAGRVPWTDLSPTLMFGPFEGFDVGLDRRGPVHWDLYERHGTFAYSGSIDEVWIEPGARAPDGTET
jgi:arylsulfatase